MKTRANGQKADTLAPNNTEAEEALLGSLIMAPEMLAAVRPIVAPEDFFLVVKHAPIYRAMCRNFDEFGTFDVRTLAALLPELPGIEEVLNYLPTTVPTALNAPIYAEIVKRTSLRRALVDAARAVVELAYNDDLDIDAVLDRSQAAVFAVGSAAQRGAVTFDAVLSEVFDDIHAERHGTPSTLRMTTPWLGLNKLIGGFQGKQLIIPAARPGHGKTAMMLQIATHAARQNLHPLIFTMEMSERELMARIIAQELAVPTDVQHSMTDAQWNQFMGWINNRAMALSGIKFVSVGTLTPLQLTAVARDYRRRGQCDVVIVDYIQLMTPDRRTDNEASNLASVTRALKALAMELDVPVIAASQMNRDSVRPGMRPQLEHLKGSGSLEADANTVLFIHDPDLQEGETRMVKNGPKEFIIAKNRNGKTGTVPVVWMGDRVMFGDMDTTGRAEDTPVKKAIKTVKTVKPGEVVGMKGTKDD